MTTFPLGFQSFLALALGTYLVAACSTPTDAPEPTTPPAVAEPVAKPAEDPNTPTSSEDAEPATPSLPSGTAAHAAGLVPLASVSSLPAGTFVPTPGYPKKGFHLGVFADEASWAAFVAASKVELAKVDFSTQMVVFAVLDAQTNALSFVDLKADGDSATFTIEWSMIEPFYGDATPGVFAIVERGALKQIEVVTEQEKTRSALGTIKL